MGRLLIRLLTFFLLSVSVFSLPNTVSVIPVHGDISSAKAFFIKRAILDSQQSTSIILDVNSAGGNETAIIDLAKTITRSSVPVYGFVTGKAWSMASLIPLSTFKIFMKPGSSIGATSPFVFEHSLDKDDTYVSSLSSLYKELATIHSHHALFAAGMVDSTLEIMLIRTEEGPFILEKEAYLTLGTDGADLIKQLSSKNEFIHFNSSEASAYFLAENEVHSVHELLASLDLNTPTIEFLFPTFKHIAFSFLTTSFLTYLLLIMGFMFIVVEFQITGYRLSGAMGGLLLSLLFGSYYLIDYAQWLDFFLFVGGFGLLAVELFVVPGFGFLSFIGFVMVFIAVYLVQVPFVIPSTPWETHAFQMTLGTTLGCAVIAVIFAVVVLNYANKLPFLNRHLLSRHSSIDTMPNIENLMQNQIFPEIGALGYSLTALKPMGKINIDNSIYNAISEEGTIAKNVKIEVIDIHHHNCVVRSVAC